MPNPSDFLVDALCRAAFAPQPIIQYDSSGQPVVVQHPSAVTETLARMLQQAVIQDETLKRRIIAEMTKPEHLQTLVAELSKGVGRMRVSENTRWDPAVKTPTWIDEALKEALTEWLGTEEAAGLIPQMLERGTVTIAVERKDASGR